MKKYIWGFLRRGLVACGFGPLIWAIVYFFLEKNGVVEVLSVRKAVMEIVTIALLAFIAGGINIVYQVERRPLIAAISIHGIVLYADYAVIYLINGWLESDPIPFFVFTFSFFIAYAVVWTIIYLAIRSNANRLNKKLTQLQENNQTKDS
jgi:hypothetical protein